VTSVSGWDPQMQHASLMISGLSPRMADAITNMLQLNSMCVTCNGVVPAWTMRFQRHRGSFYYVLVTDVTPSSLEPWLRAAEEVKARYSEHP
jgi:hypothetical protein